MELHQRDILIKSNPLSKCSPVALFFFLTFLEFIQWEFTDGEKPHHQSRLSGEVGGASAEGDRRDGLSLLAHLLQHLFNIHKSSVRLEAADAEVRVTS